MVTSTRRIAVAVAVAVLLAVAAIGYRAFGTVRYSTGSVSFSYPASWSVHTRFPGSTGFGQLDVIVGTQPWGPCAETDINCHYQQRLAPGSIEVQVSSGSLMASSLCDRAVAADLDAAAPNDSPRHSSFVRIDGRPAIRTDFEPNGQDYYLADGWHLWTIAQQGTTGADVTIEVQYRNPGGDEFERVIQRLISSVVIEAEPAGVGGSADCGAPFPPAR